MKLPGARAPKIGRGRPWVRGSDLSREPVGEPHRGILSAETRSIFSENRLRLLAGQIRPRVPCREGRAEPRRLGRAGARGPGGYGSTGPTPPCN